jgi:hypothetical protein
VHTFTHKKARFSRDKKFCLMVNKFENIHSQQLTSFLSKISFYAFRYQRFRYVSEIGSHETLENLIVSHRHISEDLV